VNSCGVKKSLQIKTIISKEPPPLEEEEVAEAVVLHDGVSLQCCFYCAR